jgi:predicted hydrocarbon binding protein
MVNLYETFKLAKLISMKDGEITLMDVPVTIYPVHIISDLEKELIGALGYRRAYEKIYKSVREGSIKYNRSFTKKYAIKDKRKALNWQVKIVTLSGWGKLEVALLDFEKTRAVLHYNNSPFPRLYKKTNYPVCIITTAFTAGGASVVIGKDLDAVETRCIAMGDRFCEIEISTPDIIAKKREGLWKKWGIG